MGGGEDRGEVSGPFFKKLVQKTGTSYGEKNSYKINQKP